MIPEYHRGLFRRIIGLCEAQEIRQGLRVSHTGRRLLIHQIQAFAVIDPALQLGRVYHVVLPLVRAAGLNDHIYIFRKFYFHKLRQITGGKAAARLQIASTQIPVDGPGLLFPGSRARRLRLFLSGIISTGTQRQRQSAG